ncbi:hypothetical protein OIU80_10305 [Flavobacterium sp. LS1R47]|jgi:hypothetical protein|uniref:Uncharacterized protein n=1 Tax=Flavobacterium frigoritolerans TaxID=2987686 RepID=A0A9X2ZL01_9FLAO|nr:hypothetical protein [Flavobacterium frigoritolerans]MCV9932675.1 hypothetical protein [Flavobacterium frigoritolerans]
MNAKKENPKINKVEEPSVAYEISKTKFKGIDRATFDFDEEMKNGLTPEEFKAEMYKRIKAYPWEK